MTGCVECGQPAAERRAGALESEIERVSNERDDYRASALHLSQLLFLADERADAAEAEVERLRTALTENDVAAEAVLALMDGHIERASNRVDEWPEDEQNLHRDGDWRSFTERAEAVSRLRAQKIVTAVLTTALPPKTCPTCAHPEGYDRLSGPCPDCGGTGVLSPEVSKP